MKSSLVLHDSIFVRYGVLLGIYFFCMAKECKGQQVIEALPRFLASSHLDYMLPQDPIRQFSNADEWGYHLEVQYRVMYNKPFLAGLYFSEAGLSRYVVKYREVSPDGDIDIREKANTRRLEGGFTAGFYPEINWVLQPYLQGRVGLALYQSSSILVDRDTEETIERISEARDHVLSYGLDFGIHIVPDIWYVRGDLRVGIIANPSARYLLLDPADKGQAVYPIDAFDEHQTAARWLKVSMGVSYLF